MARWLSLVLMGVALCCVTACAESNSNSSQSDANIADARRPLSPEEALARPRPRRLRPPPPLNKTRPPFLLSASHILIGYKGAKNAKTDRSKAEAQKAARKLLAEAQEKAARFPRLAAEQSDAPDKRGGGYLGVFPPGKRFPEIAKAIRTVEEEAIVPNLLETEFGFHVVRREKTIHVGHVLVMHKQSRFAYKGITRTPEEARVEAERLHSELSTKGADWAAIASKSSDCRRSKAVGGDLGYYGRGVVTAGGGRLLPKMIKALIPLEPSGVSKVTETEYGFHVIWRYPAGQPGENSTPTGGDAGTTDRANTAEDDAGGGES
jgi:hypothetical protein